MHVENGAQLLNATSVLLFAATVISPVTKCIRIIQRLDLMLSVSNLIELFWLCLLFVV